MPELTKTPWEERGLKLLYQFRASAEEEFAIVDHPGWICGIQLFFRGASGFWQEAISALYRDATKWAVDQLAERDARLELGAQREAQQSDRIRELEATIAKINRKREEAPHAPTTEITNAGRQDLPAVR